MEHDWLMHEGTKRHSGRYKWGSGENPYQHEDWFKGWGDLSPKEQSEYAKSFGMTLKEARYRYSIGTNMEKAAQIGHAKELRYTKQMSVKAIAEKMGVSESTVNSWLKPDAEAKAKEIQTLADNMAAYADKHAAIDIGKGVETALGIKKTKLEAAVQLLKDQGYYNVQWKQLQQTNRRGEGTQTTVLVKPKPEWENMTEAEIRKDAYKTVMENLDDVVPPFSIFKDKTKEKGALGIEPPKSVSSKRIQAVYTNPDGTGGKERDGLIELRRGAKDLSLGDNIYAQVRIAVDDTHYIKGIAVMSDDLPPGVDIRVHTNRKVGAPLLDPNPEVKQVLKPLKRKDDGSVDVDDPFGAQIVAQKGSINIVNEESKWGDWTSNRSLASQVLSKQSKELAQQQLNIDYLKRRAEFDEIQKIENPVVKEKRLIDFADECDSAAVDLKAASLPGQSVKLLMPVPSLKPGECYCPAYKDGEKLALIRYPHQSTSEIPIVTVNNSNKEGKKLLTNEATTAIGINPKDAGRLSGADFDGDTVVVIPNRKGFIKNQPEFKGLEGFEPKDMWPGYPGMKKIAHQTGQLQMGVVTNLITDMSLQGAPESEMVRAIKQAQIIIDAEKHNLNWKGSENEYRIDELKRKYQPKPDGSYGGAGTLISRSKSQKDVPERNKYYKIDPDTGEKIYTYTGRRRHEYINPNTGKKYYKDLLPTHPDYNAKDALVTEKSTKMAEAKDANELVSPLRHPIEKVYANYANQMKALGNEARKASLNVKDTPYNKQAAETYAKEIQSLTEKVNSSKVNAVLERVAQRSAAVIVDDRIKKYPDRYNTKDPDGKKHLSKLRSQVLRQQQAVLDKRKNFDVTDKEWEAIQAGALHKTLVREIINRADADRIKELSTPKSSALPVLTKANLAHARAMLNAGFTQAQVADNFNISPSTLSRLLKGM